MKKKYAVLAASLVMQACLGGVYAWSTFAPSLTEGYDVSPANVQLVFGVTIAAFTITMIFAGRLQNSYGPRIVAAIGGVFFGAGYFYASLSQGAFVHILIGIGLLSGIGTGFGYVCPLATCVKWFPRHKGLITGIAVASFGGGAVLLSLVSETFLERGVDVLVIFAWIGLLYALLIVASAAFLFVPEKIAAVKRQTDIKIVKDPFFWTLCAGMFCGTFAGLLIIGNLKPIGLSIGIDPMYAAMAISTFAVGNAFGRIFWGWANDRIGKDTLSLSLATLSLAGFVLLVMPSNYIWFIVVSFLIGFGFGACFVLYAAQISSVYGTDALGSVYPWVFLAYGLSGIVGPTAGGLLYETTGSYNTSIITASAVSLAGAIFVWAAFAKAKSLKVQQGD